MRRAAALLVIAVLTACGDSEPSPPTPRDLAEVDFTPDHTITVDEDGYEPSQIEVRAGDVVLLVNDGDEPHSFSTDDGELETGRMQPGDETTVVLRDPQVVRFYDIEAPDHQGTLTVAP
jgi:plastocyanin